MLPLATELAEEVVPLVPVAAAALGAAPALAELRLGAMLAAEEAEVVLVAQPKDARATTGRHNSNENLMSFEGGHAMVLERRWALHPDQAVGVGQRAPRPSLTLCNDSIMLPTALAVASEK